MFPTSSTTQIITPFGSGYVPLGHSDPECRNLVPAELGIVVEALRSLMFGEVMKSLRWALYLK
jgi:hypothetical protein